MIVPLLFITPVTIIIGPLLSSLLDISGLVQKLVHEGSWLQLDGKKPLATANECDIINRHEWFALDTPAVLISNREIPVDACVTFYTEFTVWCSLQYRSLKTRHYKPALAADLTCLKDEPKGISTCQEIQASIFPATADVNNSWS